MIQAREESCLFYYIIVRKNHTLYKLILLSFILTEQSGDLRTRTPARKYRIPCELKGKRFSDPHI